METTPFILFAESVPEPVGIVKDGHPPVGVPVRAVSPNTETRSKPAILVIDDDDDGINSVISILKGECGVHPFASGEAALGYLADHTADLVLLDCHMPDISGFRFLELLRADARLRDIPVIFLAGDADDGGDGEAEALEMGAVDYLQKPIKPRLLQIRVRLQLGRHDYGRHVKAMIEEKIRNLNLAYNKLQIREEITLNLLAQVTDMRDRETGNHIERTTGIVRIIVHDLVANPVPDYTLTTYQADDIIKSAKLHDLGKIAMPDQILLKPGKLTPEEFEIIKQHPAHGERLLSQFAHAMEDSFLDTARDIAYAHHEKWDGSGYPLGLRGKEIPLAARIVAVADVYDALTSRRPYKEAYDRQKALAIIAEGGGRHFDPYLAIVFQRHADEVAALDGEGS